MLVFALCQILFDLSLSTIEDGSYVLAFFIAKLELDDFLVGPNSFVRYLYHGSRAFALCFDL